VKDCPDRAADVETFWCESSTESRCIFPVPSGVDPNRFQVLVPLAWKLAMSLRA
jgi:hypothetical protein